ncbi:MAG: nucleotidyltransferase family protein [Candidatus Omnitrophica bacterium]|nr:nucleotidyltransferase family protein [Candidatus Omnitrophota bacterium]
MDNILDRWEKETVREIQPCSLIFDIGCGTGREAIEFAKLGFKVTGIDISPSAIDLARKNAEKEGLPIFFIAGDIRNFKPRGVFDCLFFSSAVYQNIARRRNRIKVLRNLSLSLRDGGRMFLLIAWRRHLWQEAFDYLIYLARCTVSFLSFKNPFLEPGDMYVKETEGDDTLSFFHYFPSKRLILKELKASGLTVEEKPHGRWVLHKNTQPPEEKFADCLCAARPDIKSIEEIVRSRPTWDAVVKTCHDEQLTPRLFEVISGSPALKENMSPETYRCLENIYRSNLANNIFLMKELAKILELFSGVGMRCIVLKGTSLIGSVYKNPALRPMADIDLLVDENNLTRIKKLLESTGFAQVQGGDPAFIKKEMFVTRLDFHTDIWYHPRETLSWELAKPADIEGRSCLMLPPEESLIYTVAHSGVRDGRISRITLLDLALIIENTGESFDWRKILKKASEYNLKTPVALILKRMAEDIQTEVPEWVLNELGRDSFLNKKIYSFIVNRPPVDNIGHFLIPWSKKGIVNKIKFLFPFFLPSPSFIKRRYGANNPAGVIFFYLARPFILLWKATITFFRLFSY